MRVWLDRTFCCQLDWYSIEPMQGGNVRHTFTLLPRQLSQPFEGFPLNSLPLGIRSSRNRVHVWVINPKLGLEERGKSYSRCVNFLESPLRVDRAPGRLVSDWWSLT
jgi:hypothetical protein